MTDDGKIVVEWAPASKIDEYADELEEIRQHFRLKWWMLSDESTVGDFDLSPEKLAIVTAELGFAVEDKDYLWEVAERYRKTAGATDGV